jgi:hypothetical protein
LVVEAVDLVIEGIGPQISSTTRTLVTEEGIRQVVSPPSVGCRESILDCTFRSHMIRQCWGYRDSARRTVVEGYPYLILPSAATIGYNYRVRLL